MSPSYGLVEMETSEVDGKILRPLRNRQYCRKAFGVDRRLAKRLFTPEIKRYLRDWLVCRRENPYPNRDEKKVLATKTGLTYTQICNWFANWRRKLKNVSSEEQRKFFDHLIYNVDAQGSAEHFSISSGYSIWEEPDQLAPALCNEFCDKSIYHRSHSSDQSYNTIQQCYQVSSTTKIFEFCENSNNNDNVKNTDQIETEENNIDCSNKSGSLLLSKWLESAERFQPSEPNYSWWPGKSPRPRSDGYRLSAARHGPDEVEAAFALATLATTTA